MAVCDLDSRRVDEAQDAGQRLLRAKDRQAVSGVTGYADYHDLLANKDIDAVVISTPDHWHAIIAIDAVRAGKDVYLQKPASLTIAEGRALSDAVHRSGPHLPDWQPAALVAAVPLCGGAGAQRPHRAAADRGSRPSRRSVRRRRADDAGAEEPELRHVAGVDAGRAVHREARPPANWIRSAGMAAVRAVRRGNDYRLGRPSHRQRALGDGYRIHRPGGDLGIGGIPDAADCGTFTVLSGPRRCTPTA